jgi:hypothetical protein
MATVKDAVRAAIAYLREFSDLMPTYNVRLEETVFDDDFRRWRIVLSYTDSPVEVNRIHKLFIVEGESGEVLAMKAHSPF